MLQNVPVDVNNIMEYFERAPEHVKQALRQEMKKIGWTLEKVQKKKEKPLPKPRWDRNTLTFFLGKKEIHRFRRHSFNQIAILDALQKRNWEEVMNGNYPRKLAGQRMWDTLKNLNSNLTGITFYYSGMAGNKAYESVWVRIWGS